MNWLITGCSTGFGRELAVLAAKKGDKVVGTLRKESQFEAFEALVPGKLKAVKIDVTIPEQVSTGVQEALEWMGQIDVLVNNAGYGSIGAVEAIDREEMIRQFDVNVFGAVEMVKAVLPGMRAQQSGHILNITSIAGLRGNAGLGIYNGSKFALEGIGEALAKELKPFNIKVTNVEPGPFRTDWAGRSATYSETQIEGYDASSGLFTDRLKKVSGQQAGDPYKGANAMYELVKLENPPVHLPLGAWAYSGARQKMENFLKEVDDFEYLGLPTDYDQ
ncbi:MAG: oxidoreductase [Bacteroidia bacterium]|nr:oxidoreductase [Bacteroidia bacterium]